METSKTRPVRLLPRTASILAATALLGLASVGPSFAQTQAQLTIASSSYGATKQLQIELNKSMIVDLPAGVAEVVVSQPGVAAAIMRTRTRAIVQGIAEGGTNIIFLDDAGRTMSVLDLVVVQPPLAVGRALEATLARVIPGSNIKVETLANNTIDDKLFFVLTGTVRTAEDKARAEAMAAAMSDGGGQGGSLIEVTGPQQVMLQVTVSEINRNAAKDLGINLSGTATFGPINVGFNSNQFAGASNAIATGFQIGGVQFGASLKALENRGAVRHLAQPTLTAMSGQTAEFLVGGEIPIRTTDANGTSITFKQYGVELNFTPVLRSNGMVTLNVDTGVSELMADGMSLSRRDVKTVVELAPGSTLAIGGLLSERTTRELDQIPGLGNIPILGALFRSNAYRSQQTEMVVLVTPYLVEPSPANSIPVPTDRVATSNDSEAFFLGVLERQYGVGASGEFRTGYHGSIGFVLD